MVLRHLVVDHLRRALRLVLGDADLPASVDAAGSLHHARRARPDVDHDAVDAVNVAVAVTLALQPGVNVISTI
jgi:hypothetical protein